MIEARDRVGWQRLAHGGGGGSVPAVWCLHFAVQPLSTSPTAQPPNRQALALEKLLLVSSGVPTTHDPPPPPLLSDLRPVNENPPRVGGAAASAGGAGEQGAAKRPRQGARAQ
jgi:hypothetical protein